MNPSVQYDEFAALVAESQASLRGFIRMLGAKPHSVDDLAQEVYVTAFRKFNEYDPERSFLAWVRGIARRILVNERRKDARRRRILDENLSAIIDDGDTAADAGEQAAMSEITAAMNDCIQQLPEKQRNVLLRRYENQESAPDLGGALGMTTLAVRQLLYRVREAIQRCIEEKIGAISV